MLKPADMLIIIQKLAIGIADFKAANKELETLADPGVVTAYLCKGCKTRN